MAIDYFNTLNLGFGYRINAESVIGLESFISQAKYDNKTSIGMGDTGLTYKYRLTDKESPFAIALVPKLFMPTGKEEIFLSDGSFGDGGLIAFESNLKYLQLALNLGYMNSKDAQYANLDYRQKIVTGIGAYIPVNDKWGGDIEFCRQNTLPWGEGPTPSEFFTGVRYQAKDSQVFYSGIGWGDSGDAYGNDFRIVAGVKWTPRFYEENATPEFSNLVREAVREEHGLLTNLKNIYFAHASFALSESSEVILDEAAEMILSKMTQVKVIRIEGQASKVGNAAYNLQLSKKRANVTRDYLIGRGIPAEKLKVTALGDSKSTLDNYASNRRVEFKVFEK